MAKAWLILVLLVTPPCCCGSLLSSARETEAGSGCTSSLQDLLSALTARYNQSFNSLSLVGLHRRRQEDIVSRCGTRNFSVELWRAIKSPSIKAPEDFGTRAYFSKFQNCDSPNPDLLWKHGDSIRIRLGNTNSSAATDNGTAAVVHRRQEEEEKGEEEEESLIMFYHVVERQYMLRICPCLDSLLPCTCEHAQQSVPVCSEILKISNTSPEDQVFPWCRGDVAASPSPLIGVPVLHYCPSKVSSCPNYCPSKVSSCP